jgi:hypothetical protein
MNAAIKATVATLALLASGSDALAELSTTPVTVANFVRAESDHMIRANMEMVGVTFGNSCTCASPPRRTTSP